MHLAVQNGLRAHHWTFGDRSAQDRAARADVNAIVAYVRELQQANGIDCRRALEKADLPEVSPAGRVRFGLHKVGQSFTPRNRSALPITETDDSDIAAAAIIGESRRPKTG